MTERLNADQLHALLRQRCDEAGSITKWAKDHNLPIKMVSNVLNYHSRPTPGIWLALGYRKVVEWEKLRDTTKTE